MSNYVERSSRLGMQMALRKLGYTGVNAEGAWDASADDPERGRRIEDNVERGFEVNDNQVDYGSDGTSRMSEPGMIPSQLAYKAGAAKIALSLSGPKLGISTPKLSPTIKAPLGVGKPKMTAAFDPRTDKPAGMNLTHGVQTVANGADVGNSYSSFSRRLQGNPA